MLILNDAQIIIKKFVKHNVNEFNFLKQKNIALLRKFLNFIDFKNQNFAFQAIYFLRKMFIKYITKLHKEFDDKRLIYDELKVVEIRSKHFKRKIE